MRCLLMFLFVLGCHSAAEQDPGGDEGVNRDPETTIEEDRMPERCDAVVKSIDPDYNQDDVYYRTSVRVTLVDPYEEAFIEVTDPDHVVVPGSTTVEGTSVVWKADGPLLTETRYLTELRTCRSEYYPFKTGRVGLPLEAEVAGRTYMFDAAAATWVRPAGSSGIFPMLFADTRIMISPLAEPSYGVLKLMATIGEDGLQTKCMPTIDIDAAWTDPRFESVAGSLAIATNAFRFTIEEFSLSGDFAPDGKRIQGGAMSGVLDTRAIGDQIGVGDSPNAVCDLLAAFQIACESCADGDLLCVGIEVEGAEAPEVPVELFVVTSEHVAHNDCD